MFLRVADTLIDLVIHALLTLDRVNQSLRVRSLDGLSHLSKFETKLKEMGISGYSFWVGKESKKLKWRTLTGPEKLIVFTNIGGEYFEARAINGSYVANGERCTCP